MLSSLKCHLLALILLVRGSLSVEYGSKTMDCNNTFSVITPSVLSLRDCLQLCTKEQCSYVNYEGTTCKQVGKTNATFQNGHLQWNTFQKITQRKISKGNLTPVQSTTYLSYTAGKVTDSDLNSYSFTGTSEPFPWWKVDLQQRYFVTKLFVTLRGGSYSRFNNIKIFITDFDPTPAQFSSLPTFATYGQATTTQVTIVGQLPGACGRYLTILKDTTEYILEMLELDIYVADGVNIY